MIICSQPQLQKNWKKEPNTITLLYNSDSRTKDTEDFFCFVLSIPVTSSCKEREKLSEVFICLHYKAAFFFLFGLLLLFAFVWNKYFQRYFIYIYTYILCVCYLYNIYLYIHIVPFNFFSCYFPLKLKSHKIVQHLENENPEIPTDFILGQKKSQKVACLQPCKNWREGSKPIPKKQKIWKITGRGKIACIPSHAGSQVMESSFGISICLEGEK